ncbi:MAG: hydroxyacylglutathione hydrolase [Gammaproteobacteria bacterium]|uniref:hydroxyacylglutathione hydrolase n=1 Tax=Marinomonas polaris TaxID=293552 RepID=UPI001D2E465F|nr:hydroxyacylglutathione hydrolase [Gammaproteobacteria bacterium]MBU1466223.1 hydroxyacylglutathione hydrolase [Gammaproteobacteria bacterium]MBU2024424.1 hydroxyacylglutathione hydrolase [Gammaproteobacteria bacterium]MBU2237275.1 hydroxyacylglutathione hydrolase [Gammaproteobacteria bacterium]MBU2319683.1 hydroxyacylglutathione hydrolase [Gammaproteobacteria bacterium]
MTIFPLPAFNDNYIWIIQDKDSSGIWAVDPGKADVVLNYCREYKKTLTGILITHHHKDHTGGVAELKQRSNCPVHGPEHLTELVTHPVDDNDQVQIFSKIFTVIATPGHTLDHLCYFSNQETPILFSGDTLFKGGCGRIMEGTPEQMLTAMTKISDLPDDTLIYGTHEYTLANYRFALSVEPNNKDLIESNNTCQKLRAEEKPTLPTKLSLEKKTNPFLRSHIEAIKVQAAQQLNEIPAENSIAAFSQVRRAKDSFS